MEDFHFCSCSRTKKPFTFPSFPPDILYSFALFSLTAMDFYNLSLTLTLKSSYILFSYLVHFIAPPTNWKLV